MKLFGKKRKKEEKNRRDKKEKRKEKKEMGKEKIREGNGLIKEDVSFSRWSFNSCMLIDGVLNAGKKKLLCYIIYNSCKPVQCIGHVINCC